ncbi:hypothetical protein SAMN05428961_1148 [Paenibacillus sp. OK060]|nr:hypothetical protein SAMN05428961_1148 [Paenibacillus sp. OK060]
MGVVNCREEFLRATRAIVSAKGVNFFTHKEVIDYMKRRTHSTSRCCSNTTHHYKSSYEDYERVQPGHYKILNL